MAVLARGLLAGFVLLGVCGCGFGPNRPVPLPIAAPPRPPLLTIHIPHAGEIYVTNSNLIGQVAEGMALLSEGPADYCAGESVTATLQTGPGLEMSFSVTGNPPCRVKIGNTEKRPDADFIRNWKLMFEEELTGRILN